MSNYSKGGEDQFICVEKDGGFITDILNIYFSIDDIPDKKWLINIKGHIGMNDLCIEITKYLQDNFEEYYCISSLKVSHIIDACNNSTLPLEGTVSEYLCDNSEIICHLESLDIWINLIMQLKNGQKVTQICVKMKVDNHISTLQVKNICQKLGIIFWNKLCNEYNGNPINDSRDTTPDLKNGLNYRNSYSRNAGTRLSIREADRNKSTVHKRKSINHDGTLMRSLPDAGEFERNCSKYLSLEVIEEENKSGCIPPIDQTQEDDFRIDPFKKQKLFVLEQFECKKVVKGQTRYTTTSQKDMFEDRLEELEACCSGELREFQTDGNGSLAEERVRVKTVLKNNDTIKCIATFKSVEEATKEQGIGRKTRERIHSRDQDELCKSPVVCNSPGKVNRRRRKSEAYRLECSDICRSKQKKSFASETSIEEQEQTCVYANIIVTKGGRDLSQSTPDQSHQLETNKGLETVNSDDSYSEPSHFPKIPESSAKKNFFSKFALRLGLKKTEVVKKKPLKINENVLSKYELERIPIPLLKNFIVQNIDPSFISTGRKVRTKSNFMRNTSLSPRGGCWGKCIIF
ncbi:unnamed protein product [Moneuplotes crassus]|uniref:Uncharacterized protein n=1 Tax=Euplotes crassus TaxID=5936 RepID=A0AAD2D961_EUPCR|nr:unnamed protein product [Moneuplotes crassus]